MPSTTQEHRNIQKMEFKATQKERYEGKGFLSFFLTCSAQLVVLSGKGRRQRKGGEGEGGKENGVGQIPPAHTHAHTQKHTCTCAGTHARTHKCAQLFKSQVVFIDIQLH